MKMTKTKEDKIVESCNEIFHTDEECKAGKKAYCEVDLRNAVRLTVDEILSEIDNFNDSFDCCHALGKSDVWSASNDDVCDMAREITIKQLKQKLKEWLGDKK